jgi:nucleotide-binding universal stress UspA family protein
MNFQRILCPVDFSETSAASVRYAAYLARRHSATLTMLHVVPAFEFEFAMAGNQEVLSQFASHRNQTAQRALELFPGGERLEVDAVRTVAQGEAPAEIVRAAKEGDHDVIVMSTHGTGAIRRWLLLGSVTTKVLQTSECPVIAAADFTERRGPLRHILCAIDLGTASHDVLCRAAGLASRMDTRLTIVHATPAFGESAGDFTNSEWRAGVHTRVHDAVAELKRKTSAEADVVVEAGEPYKVVAQVAERLDAGLVVIGRSVHTGMLGRMRAQAYEIIRNAPCPVLSV